jgi:iron complex transport system ATP-binding protein
MQRVLIARALAQNPTLLLLDEPTSHLDVHYALELVSVLRNLAQSGLAVLVAIHDLSLAARMGEGALLIGGGQVQAQGEVADVLNSSALDETFGVKFNRVEVEGNTVLVPAEATTA